MGGKKKGGVYTRAACGATAGFIGAAEGVGAAGGVLGNAERGDAFGVWHAAGFWLGKWVSFPIRTCQRTDLSAGPKRTVWIETFAAHVSSTQVVGATRHNPSRTGRYISIVRSQERGVRRYVGLKRTEMKLGMSAIEIRVCFDQPRGEKEHQGENKCLRGRHDFSNGFTQFVFAKCMTVVLDGWRRRVWTNVKLETRERMSRRCDLR